ncbi:endonuclease/exonuclease/phosphatase family protein [Micromonospora sp. NPDC000018]|uniref:endonuclease/exonuclease/phosphatase family protein n=1 Tax=Micromonospora sp. NPDC000018 TaxID=3154239 RepID=UPI00331AC31B
MSADRTEAAGLTGPQVSVDGGTIVRGQPLTVRFSGATTTKDWIGVYDDRPGSRLWKYVNSDSQVAGSAVVDSGSVHFTGVETSALTLGPHTVRMLANDSSTNAVASINVEVVAPAYATVTLDSRGGSSLPPVTVVIGNTIAVPDPPTKEGFHFAGWYEDTALTNPWDFGTDRVTADVTLFAKWTDAPPTGEKTRLKVMTLNTAVGGQNSSATAVAEAIRTTGADIVGIQEPFGSVQTFKQVTGFYYNDRLGILSRFPIIDNGQRDYVYIAVRPGEVVAISNVHLPAAPYWPYQLRDRNVTAEAAVAGENNSRIRDMAGRFATLPAVAARNVPVFLTGDFNNPSHLDWVESTKDRHFGHVVEWPVSARLAELGLRDSYREIHSDPAAKPAHTWTPGHPIGTVSPNEVHDRIDFVYAGGPVTTLGSATVGETGPYTDLAIDTWVSDHRAVLSEFEVTPAPQSVLAQDPPAVRATLTPDRDSYVQGDTIRIAYTESTRTFDIVAIYPAGTAPTEPAKVFKYTALDSPTLAGPIKPTGQVTFDAAALEPGNYTAYLLANRGYLALAETSFTVQRGATVALKQTKIAPGDSVSAAFAGSSSARDWIGIFEQQETGRSVGDDFDDPAERANFATSGAAVGDGVLTAAGGGFALQPDGQYDNFTVTFDVVDFTSWGGWLGLAFGMPNPGSNYYDIGSNLFFFQNDQNARVIRYDAPGGNALDFVTMDPAHRLSQKAETLNVKLVFEDGKLDAYWKLQSEPGSALADPKASWSGLNNNLGYLRFVVDGESDFSIDNVFVYKDPNVLKLDPEIKDGISAPPTIVIGQPYTIEYGGSTSRTDWVAITDSAGNYQQGNAPHWYYLSNNSRTPPASLKTSGTVTFTAEQTAQLSPGPMQVRFYPADGTAATVVIDVVAEELDRGSLPAWKYVNSGSRVPGAAVVETGTVGFTGAETAALKAGKVYAVRLMSDDSNTKVSDSVDITVPAPDIATLKALVTLFRELGWIDSGGLADSLRTKLDDGELGSMLNQLRAQSGRHLTKTAAEILENHVEYLMDSSPNSRR